MQKYRMYKGWVNLAETPVEFESYFLKLDKAEPLTFDWETTGLEYDAIPTLLSLHQRGSDPMVVGNDTFFNKGIPLSEIIRICNKHFPRFGLIGHNVKFDSMINVMNGIKDENVNIIADTLVMIHLVDENLDKQLEKRVKADFGYEKPTFKELAGVKWDKIDWYSQGNELFDILATYAGEDTFWTTKLYYKYSPKLTSDEREIHDKIEIPTAKILRDAKIRGVLIDKQLLLNMAEDARKEVEETKKAIYEECGCIFNLNSPKQKAEVFFDKMGLPVIGETKTGARSTDSATAEEWADMGYKVGDLLVGYSEINKLLSGYLDAIPNLLDKNNVLRGDINSCGTVTGRASAQNPNLQNQPNNDSYSVRSAFIPRPGYVFINRDYSQLELRVMAHISNDEKFCAVFNANGDIHADVAKRLNITRKASKTVSFGVLYGMGAKKLAKTLGLPEQRTKQIIEVDYAKTYNGFGKWKKYVERKAETDGYVENIFGRRRNLPNAQQSKDRSKYFGALRQSVNCVDSSTEIFTRKGWKRYNELVIGESILTYNGDSDLMEWQPLKDIVISEYKGKMLSMEGKVHSSLTTMNHRWFGRDKTSGNCTTKTSEEILSLPSKSSFRLPLCASIINKDDERFSHDWLKLFGIFLTDGHHDCLHRISICQSTSGRKIGNIEEVERLIKAVDGEITSSRFGTYKEYDPCKTIRFKGAFVEWCKTITDKNKIVIDDSFIYQLSAGQCRSLLDGIILGDGFKHANSYRIGTIIEEKLQFYVKLAVLGGYAHNICRLKNGGKYIILKRRNNVYTQFLKKDVVDYEGIVWCPRVENGSFLMRRNDKVCITRNSPIQGSGADIVKIATILCIQELAKAKLDAYYLLQVHDELLFEVREDQALEAEKIITHCMENAVKLNVPLTTDGKIIKNWGEMKNDDILSLPFRFDYSLYCGLL